MSPIVRAAWIKPGAHINAMGADAPNKQELDAEILQKASVYIDELHQAQGSGEINVPVRNGEYRIADLAGTLGEVVAGLRPRPAPEKMTVFDSTGLAIQDVALAQAIFDAARAQGLGKEVDFTGIAEK